MIKFRRVRSGDKNSGTISKIIHCNLESVFQVYFMLYSYLWVNKEWYCFWNIVQFQYFSTSIEPEEKLILNLSTDKRQQYIGQSEKMYSSTTENLRVYQGCFSHCIGHEKCRLSWQAFDIYRGYVWEKLVSHHRAVNEADSCLFHYVKYNVFNYSTIRNIVVSIETYWNTTSFSCIELLHITNLRNASSWSTWPWRSLIWSERRLWVKFTNSLLWM